MPRIPATKVGIDPYGAEIFRPIIFVTIEIGGRAVRGPALVDSGADNTLVPAEAVAPLGVVFAQLPAGIGGSGPSGLLDARPCIGVMRWDKVLLMSKFTVAEPSKLDTVLLGRSDFFTMYIPRFHWHKNPPVFDLDPVVKR